MSDTDNNLKKLHTNVNTYVGVGLPRVRHIVDHATEINNNFIFSTFFLKNTKTNKFIITQSKLKQKSKLTITL